MASELEAAGVCDWACSVHSPEFVHVPVAVWWATLQPLENLGLGTAHFEKAGKHGFQ